MPALVAAPVGSGSDAADIGMALPTSFVISTVPMALEPAGNAGKDVT